MKKTLVLILALCCLIMSCATGAEQPTRPHARPFETQTWWGMDPTCSPGCPSGQASGW